MANNNEHSVSCWLYNPFPHVLIPNCFVTDINCHLCYSAILLGHCWCLDSYFHPFFPCGKDYLKGLHWKQRKVWLHEMCPALNCLFVSTSIQSPSLCPALGSPRSPSLLLSSLLPCTHLASTFVFSPASGWDVKLHDSSCLYQSASAPWSISFVTGVKFLTICEWENALCCLGAWRWCNSATTEYALKEAPFDDTFYSM